MGKGKRNREQRRQQASRSTSSLGQHRQHKKTLVPPLMDMGAPLKELNWKERLPDMLWISALLDAYPGNWRLFEKALEPLDSLVEEGATVLDGRLSAFEAVPDGARVEARDRLRAVVPHVLIEDLGHALSLFPQAPGAWMFADAAPLEDEMARKAAGIAFLRDHIALLSDSRGEWACHARMVALGAHMRHGRVHFTANVESVKLLGRYPSGLNAEERESARTSARMMFDMLLATQDDISGLERVWAERFWAQTPRLAAG